MATNNTERHRSTRDRLFTTRQECVSRKTSHSSLRAKRWTSDSSTCTCKDLGCAHVGNVVIVVLVRNPRKEPPPAGSGVTSVWRKKRRTIDRDFWDNRRIDDISPQYSILLKSCVQFSPTVSVYCMVIGNRHFQFYCTNTSVQTSVCDDGSLLFANQALIIWAGLLGRDSPLSPLSSGESVLEFRDLLLEFGDIGQNRPSDDRGFLLLSTPAS